ncbi:hypothetical protein Q3G72_007336 [Acer saccharum]|nr:hypothetical protein Q3G72_007336 [Acer saccharum]
MRFIIKHPKVDVRVFNNENQNAEDMIDLLSFSAWNSILDILLWFWGAKPRIRRGRLFMSKDDHKEGEENRGDPQKDAFTRASLNEIAEKLVLDDPDKQTWTLLSVVYRPHQNSLTGKQRIREKGRLQLQ